MLTSEITMPWDYPRPFIQAITVQSSDMDGLGHANNSVYIQWAELAAWGHSHFLGLSLADYKAYDRAMAISKASYDYLLPCFSDDKLEMATWLTACDGKLQLERRFQLQREGKTLFRGHWITTCVRLSSGKVARMPKEFINVYGGAVEQVC
ncbi:MAG: acyl-CoA thioester hydrolase [Pseudomonadales bacterium]|jgi:acyl-CoA thioester hydrolase